MNLAQNRKVISLRIALTLVWGVIAEFLIVVHFMLLLGGKEAGLRGFLQVLLPIVGVYSAYSFSLVPHGEYRMLRAALLANPAGTVIFAGLSFFFTRSPGLRISFATAAVVAFIAGLWFLIKYFRQKSRST